MPIHHKNIFYIEEISSFKKRKISYKHFLFSLSYVCSVIKSYAK